jgi:hypothetical protein
MQCDQMACSGLRPLTGMMEYGNIGKIGLGILQNWVSRAIQLSDKIYNGSCPFEKPNIPLFHHSI